MRLGLIILLLALSSCDDPFPDSSQDAVKKYLEAVRVRDTDIIWGLTFHANVLAEIAQEHNRTMPQLKHDFEGVYEEDIYPNLSPKQCDCLLEKLDDLEHVRVPGSEMGGGWKPEGNYMDAHLPGLDGQSFSSDESISASPYQQWFWECGIEGFTAWGLYWTLSAVEDRDGRFYPMGPFVALKGFYELQIELP